MKTRQLSLSVLLVAVGTWHATAQEQPTPRQKLMEMRKTIEGLDWHKIDVAALSPIERCRTLMLLNHALNELDGAAVAEADLLGAFLEEKSLSEAYAANPPVDAPLARNFEDDDDDWYPGWCNGNMKRNQPMRRDSNYHAAAHARVDQRQQKTQSPQNSSKPPKSGGGRRRDAQG